MTSCLRPAILLAPMLLAPGVGTFPADAATGTATFNGNVLSACAIVVTSSGTMTLSSDLRTLGTRNPGGSAATAAVTTTGGMTVSLDASPTVSHPASDTTPTTWTPRYLATGAQVVVDTGSPTTNFAAGVSLLSVHLEGEKAGNNLFSQGNYQGSVTIRCE